MAKTTPATLVASKIGLWTLPSGSELHRVHQTKYGGAQFNAANAGNARFSPLPEGTTVVPTMYAGDNLECALMETLFHDVPFTNGPKRMRTGKIDPLSYSVLTTQKDIQLADLTSIGLKRLGVPRKDLIDTATTKYPRTREWAIAIRKARSDVQGLTWISRQHDTQRAFVLFGDRLKDKLAKEAVSLVSTELLEARLSEVIDLAEQLGVDLY